MPADPADEWHRTGPADGPSPYAVLKSWEKLRLVYHAVLIPWTLLCVLVLGAGAWGSPNRWELVLVGGLVANVGFCAGPVAEAYLVWVGAPPREARGWLFGLGTAFTAGAAALVVLFHNFP